MMSGKKRKKLHIGDEVWLYQIGRWTVVIWEPDGKKHYPTQSDVTGISMQVIEEYDHKGWPGKPGKQGIGPGEIKEYIEKNIIVESV